MGLPLSLLPSATGHRRRLRKKGSSATVGIYPL